MIAKTGETREAKRGLWAWAFYDWANNAFFTVIMTFVFARYFADAVVQQRAADGPDATQQMAEGVGAMVQGTAAWGYALAVSGALIALGGPVLGAIADRSGRRKRWLGTFTTACVVATGLLWFVKPDPAYVPLAVGLLIVAAIAADYALLFYNAMLPAIAAPRRVGRWSGWGWALGYGGGLLCLIGALLLRDLGPTWLGLDTQSAEHIRAAFVLAAVWYGLFALPLFVFTPDSPSTGLSLKQSVAGGLGQLLDTLKHLRQYKTIVRFLIARMVYIDGLATAFAFGGIYAAGTFGVDELTFGIAINVAAGLGAATFAWVDDWIGSRRTIILSLICLAGCGLMLVTGQSSAIFWTFGLLLGVFVGPVQAASRSYLARLAPEPLRNEVFGLYALSGKATAFLGPLMVGLITDWSNSQRLGMATLLVFFLGGLVLIWPLPNVTLDGTHAAKDK
jgi:UMF1 family MFS transporter